MKSAQTHISVRGACQHNLKKIDLDIPLHQLTVITGLSGSGKSSLAFDTLYAEGQRRYVETFSPYTRQFLERMDKPKVDRIDGIPPAIAIEQSNQVKTSRSTVGTMTEIADYLKLLMVQCAVLTCPKCQREIRPRSPQQITQEILKAATGSEALICFPVAFAQKPTFSSALRSLQQQGFLRIWHEGKIIRTDDPIEGKVKSELVVIQDRLKITEENRTRISEATESALRHGQGLARIFLFSKDKTETPRELRFANSWICPYDNLQFKPPTASLFSFNNPIGACPTCRGFGRTIEIDYERALPNQNLSIAQGVVKPWQNNSSSAECQKDLLKHCSKKSIPTDVPFTELTSEQKKFVIEGETDTSSLNELWESGGWYGVKGFFQWMETKTYKMHVRVFLSRYRAYRTCPVCHGGRFQPATLDFKLHGPNRILNLVEINLLSISEARQFFSDFLIDLQNNATHQLCSEIITRLSYLLDVGLEYLTLNRSTRTLSGGEVERVNLTSCLGNSLVNTLFVLDEPSIGLHPRDTQQLINVIQRLRDRGNTLVVVEHEEAMMRQADFLVDLGPGRGARGGEVVFSGTPDELGEAKNSATAQYLNEEKSIPFPQKRRSPRKNFDLKLCGATSHNLKNIDVNIPLGLFVAVTGVSGSGKSTLVHDVLYSNLLKAKNLSGSEEENEDGNLRSLENADLISQVIRIDQSPLTKTPRSNAAVYLGIYDQIRKLFSGTEASLAQGLTAGDFSFNGGTGRCPRCNGSGHEKIEMQFLSDLFVVCPQCEGKRFQSFILSVQYRGRNIDDVLQMTVQEALEFFSPEDSTLGASEKKSHQQISHVLRLLTEVGLEYLQLGQPLHQLSGGEAQRIKLLGYLKEARSYFKGDESSNDKISVPKNATTLFILDEPTTGLHFEDIRLLLALFQKLVEEGNSLLVIEHNLDVIKCADWVIDLGPEGGKAGGEIIEVGTPEKIAESSRSHTGRFLIEKLNGKSRLKESPISKRWGSRPRRNVAPLLPTQIEIRGARHHNLKNLSLDIQLNEMTVITGLSGSGKSTLAFDLLFAEGQRRYLDSLNAYARQFVEQLEKAEVDFIHGIPPAVAIEQRVTRGGRKSTLATVTEIHTFMRLLFAKLGQAHDPETDEAAVKQTPEEIFQRIEKKKFSKEAQILVPLIKGRKGFHTEVARWAEKKGFPLLRVDGKWIEPSKFKALNRFNEHTIEAVIGTLRDKSPIEQRRLIELALQIGRGTFYIVGGKQGEEIFSTHLFCPNSGRSFNELEPRLFSFHSPHGWCPTCQGYGTLLESDVEGETEIERELAAEKLREEAADEKDLSHCPDCGGERLNPIARAVQFQPGLSKTTRAVTIGQLHRLSVEEALHFFSQIQLEGRNAVIARDILPEIKQRLEFLKDVGLGYLNLDRSATTLSGGESQRIRLAAQLGSNLQGVLYVLDEPTIGLHPRDNEKLLNSLQKLKEKGNTLVIVEHDEATMKMADRIIDLGPGAGRHGGEIVAEGSWQKLAENKNSVTGQLLGEPLPHPMVGNRRPINGGVRWLKIEGAKANNIRNLNVEIPANRFICLCGVSGAGKSTLLHEIIKPAVIEPKRKSKEIKNQFWKSVKGAELFSAVYEVDQAPIGKTSRSTPATYIGLMDELRALFAQIPLARQRGYNAGRFSFNSGAGRCAVCQGQGRIKMEMNFLPPVFVPCDACLGRRYNEETLEVRFNEKNIADILEMTCEEAANFFHSIPRLQRPLQLLADTGLGYLTLGQPSPTLSGGESQRIKLVAELARSLEMNMQKRLKTRGFEKLHHLYLLEEPTIGLHLADVKRLLQLIQQLVDGGHTVVVIEHHLDVLAEADYLIEMGPEGGAEGGKIMAKGTPEEVALAKDSPTAPFLKEVLKKSPRGKLVPKQLELLEK